MDIISWVGKNINEVNGATLYNEYFGDILMEKGVEVYYLFNSQKGIDMILDLDKKIKAFHFYSGKQDGSDKFTDKLPFDLDFSSSREDIRLKMGVPNSSGGGEFSFLHGTTPPWDKYIFDNFKLHVQYATDEGNVDLFTIDS